jgi:hypothetical protein
MARFYMNQSGVYGGRCVRVPSGMLECAECPQPVDDYVIDPNWHNMNPLDPAIWVLKSQATLDADKDSKLQNFIDQNPEIATVAIWVAQQLNIPKATALQQLKTIYRTLQQ